MGKGGRIGRCNRCERMTVLTRHHIVPRSEGGSDHRSNIELVCRPCHDKIHGQDGNSKGKRPTKAKRRARKMERKAIRSRLQFECRPSLKKCKNCEIVCANYVIELLILFFRWLDEMTWKAYGKPSSKNPDGHGTGSPDTR